MINTKGDQHCAMSTVDRMLRRISAVVVDGLRHGYFDLRLTCEVTSHGRRRLILHAGKMYQFVIPAGDCEHVEETREQAEMEE